MSGKDDIFVTQPEKKIRFRTASKLHYNNENKVEDLFSNVDFSSKIDDRPTEMPDSKRKDKSPSLVSFLRVELTRGYLLENDEEQYSARREKVYSFMKIPREVEKFMAYGFLQCADSFLFVCTFLPIRFFLAFYTLMSHLFLTCFGLKKQTGKRFLKPAEICDLLKACIIVVCSVCMFYLDTNMLYHMIKSQSVIKLYIFYNMLEVGDRLFSAFGQDIIDALFWTATEPRDRRREHCGVIPHLFFAIAYVFFHSLLVLFQATTLNVAINSNNKALLTIMISNNFVELKGSVFKKFDKNNLFQVSCSDVRERFHLFVLLFIVMLQTMKEYSWKEERFWVLIPDCVIVLFAEVLVDWIKHAFITRFNELPVDVYRDYTTSLAYDMAQTRQKNAFSDHSDLVARRMGFIPLPLGVVMVRILAHAIQIEGTASYILVILGYVCLVFFRILNSLIILGTACVLIDQHKQEKISISSPSSIRANSPIQSPLNGKPPTVVTRETIKDSATSPIKPSTISSFVQKPQSVPEKKPLEKDKNPTDYVLGSTAIFSNSSVDLKDVCLNEELLRVTEDEIEIQPTEAEKDGNVTRSVPNIQSEFSEEDLESVLPEMSSGVGDSLIKKRAESEPLIAVLAEDEQKT